MSALSMPATGHTNVYVSGDVSIDETAAIAPGVILQACGEGRIIIKAGACLGMGTVLTANQGTIEIGEGAILGAGVLIVGYGKISDRVCIGSASTVIETSVENEQLISPGSLLGDSSRQESLSDTQQPPTGDGFSKPNGSDVSSEPNDDYWASSPSTQTGDPNNGSKGKQTSSPQIPDLNTSSQNQSPSTGSNGKIYGQPDIEPPGEQSNKEEQASSQQGPDPNTASQNQSPSTGSNGKIYGQTYIESLMVTLFPHKEHFKNNNDNQNNGAE